MYVLKTAVRYGGKDGVQTFAAGEHESLPADLVKDLGLKKEPEKEPEKPKSTRRTSRKR